MSLIEPRIRPCKTQSSVLVRAAEVADAARLLQLAEQVMAEREVILTEWDEANFNLAGEEKWIQEHRDHPGDIVIVAEVLGTIIGVLSFETHRKRKMAHAGEFGMSVASEWRGRGIGRCLLSALIDWAAAHPTLEKIELGVFATNSRAIGLYQLFGFSEEGRRRNAIKLGEGRYDDLVLMSRPA